MTNALRKWAVPQIPKRLDSLYAFRLFGSASNFSRNIIFLIKSVIDVNYDYTEGMWNIVLSFEVDISTS